MSVAFIGDVHGHLTALRRAIAACDAEGIDTLVGLGDYIEGGEGSAACVALVRQRFTHAVRGNHDECHDTRLPDADEAWLEALPETLDAAGWRVTHASPRGDEQPIRDAFAAWHVMDDAEFAWCVVGHAHWPGLYTPGTRVGEARRLPLTEAGVRLDPADRCLLVNPALVPNRDGTPPGFCVFDPGTRHLSVRWLG